VRSLARLLAGLVLLVSVAGGALVLAAGPSAALCAQPSADFLDGSDVAFAGVVVGVRAAGDDIVTTVRVDRVFKGDITRRVDVVSRSDAEDSRITEGEGDDVIVFGQLVEGEVTSDSCRTVGPGKDHDKVSSALGDGTEPSAGYLKAERPTLGLTYDQFSAARAIFGACALLGMGYIAFRAWRARRRTT
jgi:hypothetical protein